MKWANLITLQIWPIKRRKYSRDSINFNKLIKYIQLISPSPNIKPITLLLIANSIKFTVTIKTNISMRILIKISLIKNRKSIVWENSVAFIEIRRILYFLVKL